MKEVHVPYPTVVMVYMENRSDSPKDQSVVISKKMVPHMRNTKKNQRDRPTFCRTEIYLAFQPISL
jgi:hypothetical protein